MRRIVVHLDDPDALGVTRAADAAVGVYFPHAGDAGRNYTVRSHDGARIVLDVVLHSHGPGTTWAATTRPGERVGLDHARSWYRPEPMTRWQLLVSDLSGLPATARILEELSPDASATLLVEVAAAEDLDYLPPANRGVTVVPSVGTGNGCGPSRLAQMVRDLTLPDGRGYCWFAGEAAESRAVRKYLRGLGWTIDQYDITGYWRSDSETWDARFAEFQDDVLAVYTRALADGKDDKAALEEFDEACERVGL